jgi:lipopolysaccharide/colanic/teichoic acid biosynthesis glycosyltransferase
MNKVLIRLTDFLASLIGLIILSPFFILIAIWIRFDSKGAVFYRQSRVGKNDHDFLLWKFRTMHINSDKDGLITVGKKESRITKAGYFLRRFKLDELPQLLNVIKGEMSLVGPRPEVRQYVDLYTDEQKKVLNVKPGITDYASVEYSNENELLEKAEDPLKLYRETIMPAKLHLNMKFINDPSFKNYLKIIGLTLFKVRNS